MAYHFMSFFILCCCEIYCVRGSDANTSGSIIYVDWKTGTNNDTCLYSHSLPCKTLDFALTGLKNNSQIHLLPGFQLLREDIHLSSLQNVTLVGEGSLVNCTKDGVGIRFDRMTNVMIDGLLFQYCGTLQNSSSNDESGILKFKSAMYVLNSTEVTISNTTFSSNLGIGVALIDTGGNITIEDCEFKDNSVPEEERDKYPGGGGLYIEYTVCTPGYNDTSNYSCGINPYSNGSKYLIRNCTFTANSGSVLSNNSVTFLNKKHPSLSSLGNGGGILIALRGNASNNCIEILGCSFTNNSAFLGGAVAIQFNDFTSHNKVLLSSGTMLFNHATGGGGIEFGFLNANSLSDNFMTFRDYHFESNRADYGGGVAFYSSRFTVSVYSIKLVQFWNCHWVSNTATVGAAIVLFPDDWTYISGGYLPIPVFHNCEFSGNAIASLNNEQYHYQHHNISKQHLGGGIIYSDTFSINISGNVVFTSNRGSCIHISAAQINLLPHSHLNVRSNYAIKGAGISLVGYAALMACEKSMVSFVNNKAENVGGAVYYNTVDYLDFINSRRCFFRYFDFLPPEKWETKFEFINNTAGKFGDSIFATSLLPCARANAANRSSIYNLSGVFIDWKQFTFSPLKQHTISTDPALIILDETSITTSPGKLTKLGLVIIDDLNQTMDTVLLASCGSSSNCNSENVKGSNYITNNETVIRGSNIDETFVLNLDTINSRPIGIRLNVMLTRCPPGYYLDGFECECSVSNHSHKLPGIAACNEKVQRAYLEVGYWAGLVLNGSSPATAECLPGYCDYADQYNGLVTLPPMYSSINDILCKPKNRRGTLCGMCLANHSVYYHSDRFKCEVCEFPQLGLLFYVLSELLPLTLLFVLVIVFDINLMSGITSSFIFFAQTLDFFQVTLGTYNLPSIVNVFTEIYWFILGFFNLEFFRTDKLSFCLFQNANTLDVLAFKYVTTAYGLLLVGLLFLMMNTCQCHKILQMFRRKADGGQYTVTNGMTAFLVMTYSQCAKVSFELLSQLKITVDNPNGIRNINVVLVAGHLPYFGSQHLKYAVPAIIVLLYLVLIPVILIGHPLYFICKKLVSSTKRTTQGSSCSKCCTCTCAPSLTLCTKPILDAFQAPYKDNARFFAGILFLYRLVISALFSLNTTIITAFSSLEVMLILILMIRTIFHPFRNRIHNVIESLMFTDLALINGITLYNTVSSQLSSETHLSELLIIQLILIYVPIILMSGYAVYKGLRYFGIIKRDRYCFVADSRSSPHETIFESMEYQRGELSCSFSSSNLPARLFTNDRREYNYGAVNN